MMEQLSLFSSLELFRWRRVRHGCVVDFYCPVCGYSFHNGEMTRRYRVCPKCNSAMQRESCDLIELEVFCDDC